MRKLQALAFSFVMVLSQGATAWAQQAVVPPNAPPTSPPTPPVPVTPGVDSGYGAGYPGNDECISTPLVRTQLPPSASPSNEWRDKHLTLYVNLLQDGSIEDVHLLHPSGSESLDAAALAQVKQSWHWATLACNRTRANAEVTVRIPRLDCLAHGWTPGLPLSFAQPERGINAAVEMMVQPDGTMQDIHIADSSGNAALDAALVSHIRQNYEYWPMAAGCPAQKKHLYFRFPEATCIPRPVLESRTMPDVVSQEERRGQAAGAPRFADLQIGVDPKGKVLFTTVIRSSGDAALDAAAQAHVKAAWRWEPITCKRTEVFSRGEPLPVMDMARITFPARKLASRD